MFWLAVDWIYKILLSLDLLIPSLVQGPCSSVSVSGITYSRKSILTSQREWSALPLHGFVLCTGFTSDLSHFILVNSLSSLGRDMGVPRPLILPSGLSSYCDAPHRRGWKEGAGRMLLVSFTHHQQQAEP